MVDTLEIFYSFTDPYSYLCIEDLFNIGEDFDVNLLWQVYSPKAAGQSETPVAMTPEQIMYIRFDCQRIAKDKNMPIVFPETWPEPSFDPTRISRGSLVAVDAGVIKEYLYKVFHKCWGLGENPDEQDFFAELCDDLDIELGDFLSKMSASDTRERVRGLYKRAKKFNIFQTPTFVFDGELFVGYDKIGYLRSTLTKRGLKHAA